MPQGTDRSKQGQLHPVWEEKHAGDIEAVERDGPQVAGLKAGLDAMDGKDMSMAADAAAAAAAAAGCHNTSSRTEGGLPTVCATCLWINKAKAVTICATYRFMRPA